MLDDGDPWESLKALAADGLDRVVVTLTLDGESVDLTDAALEPSASGEVPPGVDARQHAAATVLAQLTPEDVAGFQLKAAQGDAAAAAVYQALVLRELVKWRAVARRVVARVRAGDRRALAGARTVFQQALTPGPKQNRARIAAFLLRDAMRAPRSGAQERLAAAPPVAPPAPPAAPAAPAPAPPGPVAPRVHGGVGPLDPELAPP